MVDEKKISKYVTCNIGKMFSGKMLNERLERLS